jgi:predicted transcriptional regulator
VSAAESESFTKILGLAMRHLRERQGLSQGQLAHRVQPYLNRATVNRVELGWDTSTATITKLLDAMGLDGRDLQKEIGATRVKRQGRRLSSPSIPRQAPLMAAAR